MKRTCKAIWQNKKKKGKGVVSTESGVLENVPYSFQTRFEAEKGTNPEELIGAAHAGCFSMAFAAALEKAGFPPNRIETTAEVVLEKQDTGFAISAIHLITRASVANISAAQFDSIANDAKANCPVSKLFNVAITLDAQLQ